MEILKRIDERTIKIENLSNKALTRLQESESLLLRAIFDATEVF